MIWTHQEIAAPAPALWALLTDLERWPDWGPSVQAAALVGDRLESGATGTVTTFLGVELGFEITDVEPGTRWAWRVAGISATDHRVEPLGPERCRVSFGVPWPAAPYLAVCRQALHRLEDLVAPADVLIP